MTNKRVPFDPILHSKLWTIVKRFHDYPDGSYESQAVEELMKLVNEQRTQTIEKALRQALSCEIATSVGNAIPSVYIENQLAELQAQAKETEGA